MTTVRLEIARGEPGRTDEQLSGKVWLCQKRREWPITLVTSESSVIRWLSDNRDGFAWEYDVTPVRRVSLVQPEPYLDSES